MNKIPPNTPKIGNGPVLLLRVGKSFRIKWVKMTAVGTLYITIRCRLAPVSNVNFFSKTDNLSKIAIYKLYLEVEVLGLDIRKFDYQRG